MQPAAQQRKQLNRDAHSQSSAFNIAVFVLLNPLKLCGELGQILRFDANSCILYLKIQQRCLVHDTAMNPQPDGALMRVLDCISQNIN